MSLHFRNVRYQSESLSLTVDLSIHDGVMVGLTGTDGSGKRSLLKLAAGLVEPTDGTVEGTDSAKLPLPSLQSSDPAEIRKSMDEALEAKPGVFLVGPAFALTDPGYRSRSLARIHELRRQGSVVVIASHDLALLERHCDEVVVLGGGEVLDRGDPHAVLQNYRRRLIDQGRAAAVPALLNPSSRHGDERAEVVELEIRDFNGSPTSLVQSGKKVSVRVVVRYRKRVDQPVVGILIRNRVGVSVYGTNTELEKIDIDPCSAGDQLELLFTFACNLCPLEYTLTVASHDPDGVAHDWQEDAIRFTVSDTRYTAGVANLQARISVRRLAAG